jgi:NitT/TauT family transport system substrate-binding protein
MTSFSRIARTAVTVAAGAALLVSLDGHASAQTAPAPLTTIRYGASTDDTSRPVLYAIETGAFKKAGLDIVLVKTANGAATAAAVAGGSVDIGKGSALTPVLAYAHGIDFTIIGDLANHVSTAPNIALLVAANSPIAGPKDLVGKTIGLTSLQDQNALAIYSWLEQSGVDLSTIKFLEVGNSAGLAAIEAGRVDAAIALEPALSNWLASGNLRILAYPFNALGKRLATAVNFASVSWVASHRDTVAAFNRVVHDAAVYVGTHETETKPLAAQYAGIDPATMQNFRPPERALSIAPSDIQPTIDAAAKYKYIAKAFPAKEIICDCAIATR